MPFKKAEKPVSGTKLPRPVKTTRQGGSAAMSSAEAQACVSTALTQLNGHSQRCANPFCEIEVEIKSLRGKHGRYCVLAVALTAML
jgi:hypothetical protein